MGVGNRTRALESAASACGIGVTKMKDMFYFYEWARG